MDKKILVVDDAMFMRSIIRKILKEAGYTQVWEAQDGEKAMELFREVSPTWYFWISPCRDVPVWRCWRRCWGWFPMSGSLCALRSGRR